jgi:hypothetical protein
MTIKSRESFYLKITPNEPGFRMTDGPLLMSRAAIDIADDCPSDVANLVLKALNKGWIQPVAYVHKNDYLADQLRR